MPEIQGEETVLRCAVCGLPFARVANGVLVVDSRHHGETHTNVVPVTDLQRLVETPEAGWPPEMETKITP